MKPQGTDGRAPLRSVPAGSRPDLGEFGEHLASRFLVRHGLVILARNLRVGRGEIDLVVRDGSTVVAVEVRTASGTPYPLDAVDTTKRARVRSLASSIGVNRCDAIGVGVQHGFVVFHWDRDAF